MVQRTAGSRVSGLERRRSDSVTAEQRTVDVHYVINQLGPGGAERSLSELVGPLADRGVRTTVWCLHPIDGRWAGDAELPCGVRVLSARGLVAKAMKLRRELQEYRPDVVHTTLFESDLVGRLAAAGTGVPVLTSIVNTTYDSARFEDPRVSSLKLALVKGIDGWSAKTMTDHFHAITRAVKNSYVHHLGLPDDKITVIPRGRNGARLGAPSSVRRARARLALGVASDMELAVVVGRQEHQKGHVHLLRAAAWLARSRPQLQTLIAGREGNETVRLRALHQRLGLGDRVRFLGNRDDVPELLAAADLFVFPSLYEGLGGALIEAMALGLPIVCSDLPALREVVEEGGNADLVEPADPESLAAAIATLLEDRERRSAYAERSRELFETRFQIGACADAHARLYRWMAA